MSLKREREDVKIENGDDVSSDEVETPNVSKKPRLAVEGRVCPWLGTIDRSRLDFDFEKLCSVSLQNANVYACLVCGKYYQGRGRGSHAYSHSVENDHHVFLNLHTKRFYCLPDDYEIIDNSLNDIKGIVDPVFTPKDVAALDTTQILARTLDGKQYLVGAVGLNNLKANDYINVWLQTFAHMTKLRDYFLLPENYETTKSELVQRFGILMRKMWYSRAFKNHVSPHELLQEISARSGKKFRIGASGQPIPFLSWFINTLHRDLGGTQKRSSSIISQSFQGKIQVTSEVNVKKDEAPAEVTTKVQPFMFLTLEIPPPPLFPDDKDKSTIIPQEPLFTLLKKFDGETKQFFASTNEWKRYRITKLPRYLVLHLNRFTKNNFFVEKNPTLVNFPLRDLDMKPYTNYPEDSTKPTKYNLIANIRHIGKAEGGTYSVHIFHKGGNKWYDIQDMVVQEVQPPSIILSEAFIQIYELQENETIANNDAMVIG